MLVLYIFMGIGKGFFEVLGKSGFICGRIIVKLGVFSLSI